jgi:hypothetical protein
MGKCSKCGSAACMCGPSHSPTKQVGIVDPLIGQMTNMPPAPSNTMGTAQPVFNPQTQMNAQGIYGGLDQRQNSLNAPLMQVSDRKDRIEAKYESAEPGSDRSKRLGAKYQFMNEVDYARGQREKGDMSREEMRAFIREERSKKRLNRKS